MKNTQEASQFILFAKKKKNVVDEIMEEVRLRNKKCRKTFS